MAESLEDIRYLVLVTQGETYSAVESKEGVVWPCTRPFTTRDQAEKYIKAIGDVLGNGGIIFKRVR